MYLKAIEATKTISHMQLVDGNEIALELHLAVRQGTEYPYYLDLKIPKDAMFASVMASAKADRYSKELAAAASDDIGKLVDYLHQIPKRGNT